MQPDSRTLSRSSAPRRIAALSIIAAASLWIISAASAQAAPYWTVEGAPLTKTEALSSAVLVETAAGQSTPRASFEIPGLGIEYDCTGLTGNGGAISPAGTASWASLSFKGCTVREALGCQVRSTGGTYGTIVTSGMNAELKTVGAHTYLMLRPSSGSTSWREIEVAKIEGKSCTWSGVYPLGSGTVGLEVPVGTNQKTLSIESSPSIQTASGEHFFFGGKGEIFHAKLGFTLASGKSWGVGL